MRLITRSFLAKACILGLLMGWFHSSIINYTPEEAETGTQDTDFFQTVTPSPNE